MFIIVPPAVDGSFPSPPLFRYLSASWHIVKVPTESISITAEKKKRVTQLCSSKTSLSWAR